MKSHIAAISTPERPIKKKKIQACFTLQIKPRFNWLLNKMKFPRKRDECNLLYREIRVAISILETKNYNIGEDKIRG